jgi:putative spermidine/putrescine transport system ATP-binding protein
MSAQPTDGGLAGAALTLRGVTKVYPGNVIAVDAIDLAVLDREFLTLLGPSGSGKTTILKLIAGFTAPTAGTIQIGDRDVSRMPAHKRNIGMVFQNYALFPHLTVDQNLAFPLEMRRIERSEIRRRIADALERVHLAGMGSRYPRQLSGGQQQRVALARAIIFEPSVLLMDEPLGALDKRLREDLQLEFKRLHRSLNVTVLYVTHDQEEALLLSDRIAVVHNGHIEQLGRGEDLYRTPRSPFVGAFMGDSNIFRGILAQADAVGASVRVDGATLRGSLQGQGSVQAGDRAALIVRPENCRIVPAETRSTPRTDCLSATVEQVVYLGWSVKYELTCAGMRIYARVTPQRDEAAPMPGESVGIEWDVADAVVVADA